MDTILRIKLEEVCKQHNVKRLYLFGSALSNQMNVDSDIDLAVQFHVMELSTYARNYFALHDALELLFGRSVDLIEWDAVTNPLFRQQVERHRQLVYEG